MSGAGDTAQDPLGLFLLLEGVGDTLRPPQLSTPEHQPVSMSAKFQAGSFSFHGSQRFPGCRSRGEEPGGPIVPTPGPGAPPERRLGTTLRPFKHPGARNPPAPLQPWRPVGEGREGQGGLPGVTRSSPLEGGAGCPRQGSGGPSNR